MICPSCGAKLRDGARFCTACGAKIAMGAAGSGKTGAGAAGAAGAKAAGATEAPAPEPAGAPGRASGPSSSRTAGPAPAQGAATRPAAATSVNAEPDPPRGEHAGLGARMVQFRRTTLRAVPTFVLVLLALLAASATAYAVYQVYTYIATEPEAEEEAEPASEPEEEPEAEPVAAEEEPEEEEEEEEDPAAELYAALYDFSFASSSDEGQLIVSFNEDGTFIGEYIGGASEQNTFSGSLGAVSEVADCVYTVEVQSMDVSYEAGEQVEDPDTGDTFVGCEVVGLAQGDVLTVYAPGVAEGGLPDEVAAAGGVSDGVLTGCVIYNETTGAVIAGS